MNNLGIGKVVSIVYGSSEGKIGVIIENFQTLKISNL